MKKWQKKIFKELKALNISPLESAEISVDRGCAYVALAACILNSKKNFVIIASDLVTTENLAEDLRNFQELISIQRNIHVLPEIESTKRQITPEVKSNRCKIYDSITPNGNIYFTSITSLLAPAPEPEIFRQGRIVLKAKESNWPPEKLAEYLVSLDYDNEVQVNLPGEFSWRGGILDVYSPVSDYPVRIDYWGNVIESMRLFNPNSQRSIKEIEQCAIIPCGEQSNRANADEKNNFLNFFEEDSLILILFDTESVESHLDRFGSQRDLISWKKLLSQNYPIIYLNQHTPVKYASSRKQATASFFSLEHLSTNILPEMETSISLLHFQYLREYLRRWYEDEYEFVLCAVKERVESRLHDLLEEERHLAKSFTTVDGISLSGGVIFPKQKIVILSEVDVFGQLKVSAKKSKKSHYRVSQSISSDLELMEGDFAVHAVHGICRYIGLKREPFRDRIQEVLLLEFADEVKMFVPLDQSYLISRYVGASKKLPRLSRIGSSAWRKAKRAAIEAVNDLAAELIRIQAVRNYAKGFAFTEYDQSDMRKFVNAFPYNETEDQKSAIDHVLNDMEQTRPMDRLICGDVGYGKTEVALRGACRAVLCGQQVAVLVPTTVLAQQHFLTFCERFSELPIVIDSLSRFKSRGEQRKILERLANGQIDIVIGTHRLLQPDIRFRSLGVIIIDEEQRFGVRDKEKLKKLRANLDILTLTATPIPRTLYMSMSGIRDMSTIMTAPLERLPIKTIVSQYDEKLIVHAVNHELQRSGQVYFLHNRVKTIYRIQEKLRSLLPNISIVVAHGQMHESELETAMIQFIEGEIDVLLCTTIIESGMDIPNANTIIIDRADRFGLAELYQLRGRVGRYDRQAYAYLLLPPNIPILDAAKQRLVAIQRYTQLGVGFKLALRDLEIRGAGNIIGAEQSGHISAIGFELYCQLMKEAVAKLKKQRRYTCKEVILALDFLSFGKSSIGSISAEIPHEFIEDNDQRLHCYRRLSHCLEVSEVDDFSAELRDRFGVLPPAVENLLTATKLKTFAAKKGIQIITVKDRRVIIETDNGLYQTSERRLPRLTSAEPNELLEELVEVIVQIDGLTANERNPTLQNKRRLRPAGSLV